MNAVVNENKTVEKTRQCPHCAEILENVTSLEFGRHVQFCLKRKTVKTVLPKHTITVCNVDHPDPRTPMNMVTTPAADKSARES